MLTTSLTLLERLRQPGDQEAWRRFVHLYTPLLYHWTKRVGMQESDASDLIQEVLTLLVRKLGAFHYDQRGSFRSWLRTVTLNKWREQQRRTKGVPETNRDALEQVAIPDPAVAFEEKEYCQQLVARALQLLEPEFSRATWRAFQEHVVAGRDAATVAEELGLRVGTVYAAKSRVLTRLRQELHGLLD